MHSSFQKQYNVSYITRFNRMKELILSNPAISEYDLPLYNLGGKIEQECIVIGIIFLDSKLKYSILKMNGNDSPLKSNENEDIAVESYLPGSQLYIEDSFGKIPLVFKETFNKLKLFCTGIVLGFVGYKDSHNVFRCKDVIFPKKIETPADFTKNIKILFMSNPLLSNNNEESVKDSNELKLSSKEGTSSQMSSPISKDSKEGTSSQINSPVSKDSKLSSNELPKLSNKIQCSLFLDYFAGKVSNFVIFGDIFSEDESKINVDDLNNLLKYNNTEICLVPGPNDPTNKDLPQDNFHPMLFDKKIVKFLKSFKQPGYAKIGGVNFVFINRQIVENLKKSYNGVPESDLDILEELVNIRLTAPNCPDTMDSSPFSGEDPFLIQECNFMILGGCSSFEMRRFNNVTLVCLPDFSRTSSAILFDSGNFKEVTLDL